MKNVHLKYTCLAGHLFEISGYFGLGENHIWATWQELHKDCRPAGQVAPDTVNVQRAPAKALPAPDKAEWVDATKLLDLDRRSGL